VFEYGYTETSVNASVHLVDDDECVRIALTALLDSLGWDAHAYSGGREFLREFNDAPGNCVLLDLHMPDQNGAEVLAALRARGSRVPVIIMTAKPQSALADLARSHGISSLLVKPMQDDELKLAVESAVSGSS
jgi:two-component system response regulator FixJ